MAWLNLIDGTEFLHRLFPQEPQLKNIRLMEVGLHQDGSRITIRFDLNDYPASPPPKWSQAQANTVQVILMGMGIRELSIKGWAVDNFVDIQMERVGEAGVCIEALGPSVQLRGVLEYVRVQQVSAYANELDVP